MHRIVDKYHDAQVFINCPLTGCTGRGVGVKTHMWGSEAGYNRNMFYVKDFLSTTYVLACPRCLHHSVWRIDAY